MDDFITRTAKSTVAVIIPLFGYWNDIKDNPVNGEVLNAVLKRVYSNTHNLLLVFVANPQTMPHTPDDPESVTNLIAARAQGGNVKMIPVPREASYPEYIREGMDAVLEDTQAQFIVVLNPWVMLQEGGLDAIVNRANGSDDAKIISGFNVRTDIDPSAFDKYRVNIPKEEWDISFDLLAMPRYVAEMAPLDPGYITRPFLELDIFNAMRSKAFAVVTSQQIPIFPFDFPWTTYETREMFEADRAFFIAKWGFDPGVQYGQEGISS